MSTLRTRLNDAIEQSCFRDGSAYDLAAARVVIAVHAMWILLSRELPKVSDLPAVYWTFVPQSNQWRYLLFHGHGGIEAVVQAVAIAALLAAALGVAPRLSLLTSALLLYHLAPMETFIWSQNPNVRGLEVTILALVILAFAPCAEVWSIRSAIRRIEPPVPAWQFQWPLALVQLFVVEIYFLAGYHKLHISGLAWVEPENMRKWLLALTLYEPVSVFTSLGRYIADRPVLCLAAGVGTVVFELASPIVLFVRRSRVIWVPLAVTMHIGIFFAMNIAFLNTPQLLIFVNWAWLRGVVRRWRAGSRALDDHTSGPQPLPHVGAAAS